MNKKKLHVENVTLYFRKAMTDNKKYLKGEKLNYDENPFEYWLKQLRKKYNDNLTSDDKHYWNLLFDVEMRGKRDLSSIEDSNDDPEYKEWVRNLLENGDSKSKLIFT